jgi:hypothetical protein
LREAELFAGGVVGRGHGNLGEGLVRAG